MVNSGRQIFRYDLLRAKTFGAANCACTNPSPGTQTVVSGRRQPKTALAVGLKVDANSVPANVAQQK